LFRTHVPLWLQDRFAKREIIRSLHVRSMKDADRVAQVLLRQCGVVFMVVSLNPELSVAETNAFLKSFVDGRTAYDEAALLNLDRHKTPTFEDVTTPSAFSAHARAMAKVLEQKLKAKDFSAFADQAKDLLAGRCATAVSAKSNECLVSAALSEATIASLKMQELHAAARFPDAPALPTPVIEECAFDPRILRVMGRMRSDDRYGEVLTHDQIRQFLAGSDFQGSPDDLHALIDEEAVRKFAEQRPADSVIQVEPTALSAIAELPAYLSRSEDKKRDTAPNLLPALTPAQVPDDVANRIQTATQVKSSSVPENDMLISSAWPTFAATKVEQGDWRDCTAKQSEATLRLVMAVCGDICSSEVRPATCHKIRTLFLQIPANYDKSPRWRAIAKIGGLNSVAATFQAEINNGTAIGKPLTKKIWNRHLTCLNAFKRWAWGAVHNRDGQAPTLNYHIKQEKMQFVTAQKVNGKRRFFHKKMSRRFSLALRLSPQSATWTAALRAQADILERVCWPTLERAAKRYSSLMSNTSNAALSA
jgi:hypothetical protein